MSNEKLKFFIEVGYQASSLAEEEEIRPLNSEELVPFARILYIKYRFRKHSFTESYSLNSFIRIHLYDRFKTPEQQ